jgi:hypothetical protein
VLFVNLPVYLLALLTAFRVIESGQPDPVEVLGGLGGEDLAAGHRTLGLPISLGLPCNAAASSRH